VGVLASTFSAMAGATEPLSHHEMRVCGNILFGASNKLANSAKSGDKKALDEMNSHSTAAVIYIHKTKKLTDKEAETARAEAREIEKSGEAHEREILRCKNSLNESTKANEISDAEKDRLSKLANNIVDRTVLIKK
jgi:hypothetical protein